MNAIVLGVRRQGKSTLSYWLARQKHETVLIFDPNSQFPGFPVLREPGQLKTWLEESERKRTIVMRPNIGEFDAFFDDIGEILVDHENNTARYENYSLIVDEASVIQKSWGINPTLEWLIRRAPESVYIVQNAHKMTDINSVSWTSGPDTFFFSSQLARDLKHIDAQYGAEVAKQVSTLGKYQCVHCWVDSDGGARHWKRWDESQIWYVDFRAERNLSRARA